ncbi:hypothetical protein AVEN_44239-1 [Araneus ventricosus]|uniref:DDE-1 domain-containing protein n=1 Tax=Araneus ventricosus TaxID=182803 RepID=A0A4Y2MFP5_ARAVE|nr:hypothetical protein AVEN_44239-1 [Araneus ventricosus]
MLPTKTLASRKEAAAPGYKRSKDRVTVYLCSSASGTHQVLFTIEPRRLLGRTIHRTVSFQICSICKRTSQVPEVSNKSNACVRYAPSHPSEEELKDGNIQAVFLPPNVMALIQPMDQGMIESVKRSQDIDAEDVEQWLAIDKDLQQETLSDKDIISAVTGGIQDDGDNIIENTTSLISHTDGMKAIEAALWYMEQKSSASPIDVMLIKKKNGKTMRHVAELQGFNKKKRLLIFFNGM